MAAVIVVGGLSVLLLQMGDEAGGLLAGSVAVGLGVLWMVNLVVLLLAVAMKNVGLPSTRDEPEPAGESDEESS